MNAYRDYLLIAIMSGIFCVGLAHKGMPIGHDLIYEVTRVAEYTNSLKNGGFPVRWSKNLERGCGEPIFNFFPPLFLTVSSIQILLGLSIVTAIKGSIFLFTFASGIGMYMFAKEFYNRGLIVSCAYIFAPYHMVDVYIRNAYSEYAACSMAPFVFWGIALVCKERKIKSQLIFLLSASGTLFALSHNLSLLMYTPLFVIFFALNMILNRNWKSILSILVSGALAFLLSAFYILPVLLEKEFIQTWQLTIGKFDISKNFATLSSLFGMISSEHWYSLTPFSLVLFALVLTVMIFKKKKINQVLYANLSLFIGFLVILLFLTTSSSSVIWKTFPSMKLFQFPWRLLSPVTFVICFLAGSIMFFENSFSRLPPREEKKDRFKFCLPITLFVMFAIGVICVFFFTRNSSRYVIMPDAEFSDENIQEKNLRATVLFEYRPIWVKENHELPLGKGLTSSYLGAKIEEIRSSTTISEYKVLLPEKAILTANIHFFPGWTIYNNGNPVSFKITAQGLMEFWLPPGTHNLKIVFENTPARLAGNFLSLLGLLGFGIIIFTAFMSRLKKNTYGADFKI